MNIGNIDLNCFMNLPDPERKAVVEHLHSVHQGLSKDMRNGPNINMDLAIGIEWVLQGLGAEGYESA